MTPFEQQVADALTGIKLEGTILGRSITLGKQVAREIAPRVAAAICDGIAQARMTTTTPQEPYPVLCDVEDAEAAALATLRGSPEQHK